jgi:hypothetical protein
MRVVQAGKMNATSAATRQRRGAAAYRRSRICALGQFTLPPNNLISSMVPENVQKKPPHRPKNDRFKIFCAATNARMFEPVPYEKPSKQNCAHHLRIYT